MFNIFFIRNLKRLVHAMILKRPPGEWLGILRSDFAKKYLGDNIGLLLNTNILAYPSSLFM